MTWHPMHQDRAASSPVSDESPCVLDPRVFEYAQVVTFGILMIAVDRYNKFIGLALITEGRLRTVSPADERRMENNGCLSG